MAYIEVCIDEEVPIPAVGESKRALENRKIQVPSWVIQTIFLYASSDGSDSRDDDEAESQCKP